MLIHQYLLFAVALFAGGTLSATSAASLTLEEALNLVRTRNPAFAVLDAEAQALGAEARVAGRWENPELSVEVEDFGGSDALSGFGAAETTVSLSQKLPLGKTASRISLAFASRSVAEAESERDRRAFLAAAARSFADAWETRALADFSAEAVTLAGRAAETVTRRAEAGVATPAEHLSATTELALARTAEIRARHAAEAAIATLAACWGGSAEDGETFLPEIPSGIPPPAPSEETLAVRLELGPEAHLLAAGERRAAAEAERAKAERLPDPTLSAGVRYRREDGETSFLVGVSMPLPIFETGSAVADAAHLRLTKVRADAVAAKAVRRAGLTVALRTYEAARAEAQSLRAEVLPSAERGFHLTELAYENGKLDFLTLLEASRTLVETRRRAVQALAESYRAHAELVRLVGPWAD